MRRVAILAAGLAASLAACTSPTSAMAQPVLVLNGHRVVTHDEPLGPFADLPPPPSSAQAQAAGLGGSRPTAIRESGAPGSVAMRGLQRMRARGVISASAYARYTGTIGLARAALANLGGTRQSELASVFAIIDGIASRGALTPSRLNPLFLTLGRNRQWWTTGPLLSDGQRVSFNGSQLIFQYYSGEGLQLQMLGNWGKVNGLWQAHADGQLRSYLSELIPLAVARAGGLAWEYYFPFGGGEPPWTSGLSQGSAVQGLARAWLDMQNPSYLSAMRQGLSVFSTLAPEGVRERARRGNHYLLYSYAPGYHVLNGFIGSLDALYDVGYITGDVRAKRLLHLGEQEAQYELPFYDTGSWANYSNQGETSSNSYMGLLRDFLAGLCARTGTGIYCTYAHRFTRYIVDRLGHDIPAQITPYHPPKLRRIPARAPSRRPTANRPGGGTGGTGGGAAPA